MRKYFRSARISTFVDKHFLSLHKFWYVYLLFKSSQVPPASSIFCLATFVNAWAWTVNLDSLVKEGLIFKPKFPLKILGNGKLNVKLKVQAHAFTKVAKQKIEDAGGSCELINNK